MQLVMTPDVVDVRIGQISSLPVKRQTSPSGHRMVQQILLLVLELFGAVSETYTCCGT